MPVARAMFLSVNCASGGNVFIYRNINTAIWSDDKFPFVSNDCQLVFFHLLTSRMSSPIGIYVASLAGLAAEKRWEFEKYRQYFQEGLSNGFWKYDERFYIVYFPNFFKWNRPANPNVLKSWIKHYNAIPNHSPLKSESIRLVSTYAKSWGKPFEKVCESILIDNGLTFPKQDQEQNQNQEQDQEDTPAHKRNIFLDYVMLTEDEHEKLINEIGRDNTNEYIERLNNYIGSKGKKYKSHYHTILNWWRKDNPVRPEQGKKVKDYHEGIF